MLISFNNHYPHPTKIDYGFKGNLPLSPQKCFKAVFNYLQRCGMDKNQTHTLVMPGVREGIVLSAYHALMGHFPYVLYSRREGDQWVWELFDIQKERTLYRGKR